MIIRDFHSENAQIQTHTHTVKINLKKERNEELRRTTRYPKFIRVNRIVDLLVNAYPRELTSDTALLSVTTSEVH